jgi:hypothetical protein
MKFTSYMNESSLSRVWKHNKVHDCAAMTAFRKARNCGEGDIYTRKENQQRNKSLMSKLMSKGYKLTRLIGRYPEGGKDTKEMSYFIVDINDSGILESVVKSLGEEFEQDSVLFIPKGSIDNKSTSYLIGTNRCPNNWLGYGKKEPFEKSKLGYESPIYTSYVNGRPFIFESVDREMLEPGNGMGWWMLYKTAKKNWESIEL